MLKVKIVSLFILRHLFLSIIGHIMKVGTMVLTFHRHEIMLLVIVTLAIPQLLPA